MKTLIWKRLKQQIVLLTICLFFIPISAKAQSDTYEYVPIPDNAVWSVNTAKFKTFGDTIINNNNYLKVYFQNEYTPFEFDINKASYYCALRNDTINKRVYGVYKDSAKVIHIDGYSLQPIHSYLCDTTEFLLYDFSLEVGDTVSVAAFFDGEIPFNYLVVYHFTCVLSNDSLITLNNNTIRRKIAVDMYHRSSGIITQYWREGIGSTNGLFSPSAISEISIEAPLKRLLCFSHNDELLLEFPEHDYDSISDDCYSIGDTSSIKEYDIGSGMKLYPNPAQNILTIEIQDADILFPCKVMIFDILGKELKRYSVNNSKITLNISDLSSGIYILKTSTQKGSRIKKFVKE